MAHLSVSKSHIVIRGLTYRPEADLVHSLGGRKIASSRTVGPGQSFQFPRQNWWVYTLRRAVKNLEEDPSVQEFLSRQESTISLEQISDRLFDFQKSAVQFLSHGNHLLSIAPGRGKTIVSLETIRLLRLRRVLIVAPVILLYQWKEQIFEWYSPEAKVQIYRTDSLGLDTEAEFVLTNYEMIIRRPHIFNNTMWDVAILDESIIFKNRKTVRYAKLKALRPKCRRVWALSGFPISKDISDLWGQFSIIEPSSFRSFWTFVFEYCRVVQGTWGAEIVGSKPGIDLNTEFSDIMRIVPADVISLPEPEIIRLSVPMTPKQQSIYNTAESEFLVNLASGQTMTFSNRLTQMVRLSQIVENLSFLGHSSESGKLDALTELVEIGYLKPPALIWGRFRESLLGIQKTLQSTNLSVRVLDGSTSEELRQTYLNGYKNGTIDILIIHLRVGKYGLNLTNTQTVVYYDLSFALDDLLQSFYRVFRVGLDHVPFVYALAAAGSIDDLVSTNLKEKLTDLANLSNQELLDLFQLVRGSHT